MFHTMRSSYSKCIVRLAAIFVIILFVIGCHSISNNKPFRVACIGDSITYGMGISQRIRYSYPVRLSEMSDGKLNVKNFGVNGATILKKGHIPFWNQKEFKDALLFLPDIVVIMFGTNDAHPFNWRYGNEFIKDYSAMIDTFAELETKPRIFVCLPVPICSGEINTRILNFENNVIPQIKKIALVKRITLVDLYNPLFNKEHLFADKFHPNADGAGVIAEVIYHSITELREPKRDPY